ncbi:MAG TPA: hypothetical protein VEO36_07835 [Casimicrobiaceae bacterium]|nr:hypothetical protein [Casimicrobiaceae bacterium]
MESLPKLEGWHDFYVVVGSGAAALTGLLFVIVSLGPKVVARGTQTGVRAFISPIAVHFTSVLVGSALLLAPDIPPALLGSLLAIGGLGGIIYTAWTRGHAQWRHSKLPILDWVWFIGLPFLAFFLVAGSGIGIAVKIALCLHSLAAAIVLLIVIAIRNAWDIVVWMTTQPRE